MAPASASASASTSANIATMVMYDVPIASMFSETEKPHLDELPPLAGGFGRELRKINKRRNCNPDRCARIAGVEIAVYKLPAACVLAAEAATKLLEELSPLARGFVGAVVRQNKKLQKSNLAGHEVRVPTILVNDIRIASISTAKAEMQSPDESSPLAGGFGRALRNRRRPAAARSPKDAFLK